MRKITRPLSSKAARSMIEDAMRGWMQLALEDGNPVPEPVKEEYAGKILPGTPESLYRMPLERAKNEGAGLNQFLVYQPSKSIKG